MAKFWSQTEREKRGTVAGLGIFFGALLGANLGTLGELPLRDYIFLVILLAGAVVTIQMTMTSERRGYVVGTFAIYLVVMAMMYLLPDTRPEIPEDDLLKLAATMGIWLVATLSVELTPTIPGEDGTTAEIPSHDA